MAALTVNAAPGLTAADSAGAVLAAGGDTFANDGQTLVALTNTDAAAREVTFVATGLCSHGGLHNHSVTVPAGGRRVIGPFPLNRFGRSVATTYASGISNFTAFVYRSA